MSDLQAHIDKHNAEVVAYNAENPGCHRFQMANAAHFAEDGIYTVEQLEMTEMLNTMSDLAKAAYGTRSACPDTDGLSFQEVSALYDSMLVDLEHTEMHEQAYQAECVERFEKSVADTIAMGAGDRETAVRWLREAEQDEDSMLNNDYFEYDHNLPNGYLEAAA